MIELVLGAFLAGAVVLFVAVPFLRETPPELPAQPADADLAAAEERDRVLAELKELEFDHRTGKIGDDDYRALVRPLREQAARTFAHGSVLSGQTAKNGGEQRFSSARSPSDRRDR